MRTNETTRPACRNTAVSDSPVIPAKNRHNTEQFPVIPSDSRSDSLNPQKTERSDSPNGGTLLISSAPTGITRIAGRAPLKHQHTASDLKPRLLALIDSDSWDLDDGTTRVVDVADLRAVLAEPEPNEPQTFVPSQRTQGQRRWRVHRISEHDAQVLDLGLTQPWGVCVDDVDKIPGDLVWVGNFETFEQAVTFADRQARS